MAERRRGEPSEISDQNERDIEAGIDALNKMLGDTITPSDPDLIEKKRAWTPPHARKKKTDG